MRVLVVGATGMVGSYMSREARARGYEVRGLARSSGDYAVDITRLDDLHRALRFYQPHFIINCAGLVDLERCEREKRSSWAINVDAVGALSMWTQQTGSKLIHVSTDQFIDGCERSASAENCSLSIRSTYAAHKLCGEQAASIDNSSLILRTAVTGAYAGVGKRSLWDWAFHAITHNESVNLFYDAFTSLIDAKTFCRAVIELMQSDCSGIFNIGSTEVFSKKEFFLEIVKQLNVKFECYEDMSVSSMTTPRNTSLGLNVTRAEQHLSFALPRLNDVVSNLIAEVNNHN